MTKRSRGKNSGKQAGRVENLRAHQYKPGQSGNPKGRPSTRGLTAHLKAELERVGRGNVSTEQLVAKKLVRLALRSNLLAIRECFDRTEGKARQQLDWNDITLQLQGRSEAELLYFADNGTWPDKIGNA